MISSFLVYLGRRQDDVAVEYVVFAIFTLFFLYSLIPSLSFSFRRLHDINMSAWWILVGVIPFLGPLVLLVLSLVDGTPGENRFGADPKGRVQSDEEAMAV
jgi:uncharacterized membrane protein YhaH (DUF805 family)